MKRQKEPLFLFFKATEKRLKTAKCFQSGDKAARIDNLQSDVKARKNVFKQARICIFIPC